MNILKYLIVIFFSVLFSYLTFEFFGNLYIKFFNPAGSWLDFSILSGFSIAYVFSIFLLTPILLKDFTKWHLVFLSLPAIVFEIVSDPLHIYFPFVFGFIGLGLGLLARRLYTRYLAK